ncbi:hypothetical protein PFLUV_G00193380 [Perca fluviatilis]|uniref:Uncharacterized protein n=1 Tax=Perca fluviatilis TaxID=8168 RepID=A0A6A5ERT5_PERFL|nr:hypothetical protein PFLUV_G00193380 [Perca fluviatilis]
MLFTFLGVLPVGGRVCFVRFATHAIGHEGRRNFDFLNPTDKRREVGTKITVLRPSLENQKGKLYAFVMLVVG